MDYPISNDNSENLAIVSRELLKYYLEWDITVEIINDSYYYKKGERVTLVNSGESTVLRNGRYVREEFACVRRDDHFRLKEWIPLRDIIPILRPYSTLCKPLPDGTIPSVEIAKLIKQEPNFQGARYLSLLTKKNLSIEDNIGIYLPSVDCVSVISYYDWWALYETEDDIIPYKVYDYLYSEHFAIEFKRHQFIEAV